MYPTIESSVETILTTVWNKSNGSKVPQTDDVALSNGAKEIEATYLYADLAESSKYAQTLYPEVTGKIIRTYINTASRILNYFDGEIRSFDGDRVMAIFMGDRKEWAAVRAALAINWAVTEVIRPKIKANWSDGDTFSNIQHAVGIDTGAALVIRGGVRNHNDLISVGHAPNVAAKLSEVRNHGSIIITDRVKQVLTDDLLKYETNRDIWRTGPRVAVGGKYQTTFVSDVYWSA